MIEIPGDNLEGGGQIVRTAVVLSCITGNPIRVYNIRANRPNPGIKPQLYYTLQGLSAFLRAQIKGLELDSTEIIFTPSRNHSCSVQCLEIDLKTAAAIGLAMQILLPVAAFKTKGVSLRIKGGTCGLGAVPIDYYPEVVFPILARSGLRAELEIVKRGYYPKGGGEIRVKVEPLKDPKGIVLTRQGKLISIRGKSIASQVLAERQVNQRQAKKAEEALKKNYKVPVSIENEYTPTLSPGSEINLYAHFDSGCILWSDVRGERGKPAEEVGIEAAEKLIKEISSQAGADFHLADNLIPWLSLLGGEIKTSHISQHTKTNMWVCELFFGRIFEVRDTAISCKPQFTFP